MMSINIIYLMIATNQKYHIAMNSLDGFDSLFESRWSASHFSLHVPLKVVHYLCFLFLLALNLIGKQHSFVSHRLIPKCPQRG